MACTIHNSKIFRRSHFSLYATIHSEQASERIGVFTVGVVHVVPQHVARAFTRVDVGGSNRLRV